MSSIIEINTVEDIPVGLRNTAAGKLLEYHNFKKPHDRYAQPELLLATCMDFRVNPVLPERFAYVIRTAGASLRSVDFPVSYAIGAGGVENIVVMGHTDCGMVQVHEHKEVFKEGLARRVNWPEQKSEDHFHACAPLHEIGDAVAFTLLQVVRLKSLYPGILIVAMLYDVATNKINLLKE